LPTQLGHLQHLLGVEASSATVQLDARMRIF